VARNKNRLTEDQFHESVTHDYFAAIALNGMLASNPLCDRTRVNKRKWAKVAFEFADAMMAERKKRRR